MMRIAIFSALLLISCGGAPKAEPEVPVSEAAKAPEAQPAANDAAPSAAAETVPAIPTECAKSGRLCLPDQKFIKRMCNDSFPSIALYLFGNGLPFSKGYLTRKTQAWNAAGGASDNTYLEFDEEVLLLVERNADAGGMQVRDRKSVV